MALTDLAKRGYEPSPAVVSMIEAQANSTLQKVIDAQNELFERSGLKKVFDAFEELNERCREIFEPINHALRLRRYREAESRRLLRGMLLRLWQWRRLLALIHVRSWIRVDRVRPPQIRIVDTPIEPMAPTALTFS